MLAGISICYHISIFPLGTTSDTFMKSPRKPMPNLSQDSCTNAMIQVQQQIKWWIPRSCPFRINLRNGGACIKDLLNQEYMRSNHLATRKSESNWTASLEWKSGGNREQLFSIDFCYPLEDQVSGYYGVLVSGYYGDLRSFSMILSFLFFSAFKGINSLLNIMISRIYICIIWCVSLPTLQKKLVFPIYLPVRTHFILPACFSGNENERKLNYCWSFFQCKNKLK